MVAGDELGDWSSFCGVVVVCAADWEEDDSVVGVSVAAAAGGGALEAAVPTPPRPRPLPRAPFGGIVAVGGGAY